MERLINRSRLTRATALLAVLLLLTSCGLGKRSPTGSFDYTGTWRGSLNDETSGAGAFMTTLQQVDFVVTGTWHSVMGSDAARQDGGALSGQLFVGKDSDLLEVTLSPAVAGQCSYKLTLSRAQETISGSYVPVGSTAECGDLTRGTVQVSKQQQ